MGSNYPMGAELDSTAPWNQEEQRLSCPRCKMDYINTWDNICVCNDCGYENYLENFIEAGKIENEWERVTYDGE